MRPVDDSRAFVLERLLRWPLAAVYVWFGALKVVGMSPAFGLVRRSYPALASAPGFAALGVFELALGLVLAVGVWTRWAAAAVVLHLDLFVDLAPAGLTARRFATGGRIRVSGQIGKTRDGEVGFIASEVVALGAEP